MKKGPPLLIKQLHLVARHLETCAIWNYQQWGKELGFSYQSSLERVRQDAFSLQGEAGIIAFWDDVPVGMSFLETTGADEHPDLTPWLSGVYVEPDYRGKGIAKRMIETIEDLAYEVGKSKLYLHTPNAKGLYIRLGWEVINNFQRKDTGPHVVMRKTLI